jgi:hypothetical protein
MAGLDPAIQEGAKDVAVCPWMAASGDGHDVGWRERNLL